MRSLVLVGALISIDGSSAMAAADCAGETRQEHHIGNFDFVTSSWVEPVGERMRYVSCVANLDEGSDLLVHWFIPGPYKSYVPSSKAVSTPRLRDDVEPRPVTGCLQFGQLGELTNADFLGTKDDQEKNGNGDCERQVAEKIFTKAAALPDNDYADELVAYFPSDAEDPYNTMLHLRGKIGIVTDGSMYRNFFEYQVGPLEGREKGKVSDVRVEPFFPGSAEIAYAFYKDAGTDFSKVLNPSGYIAFDVVGKSLDHWKAVEAYYQFLDKNNNIVAVVPMPLLLEMPE